MKTRYWVLLTIVITTIIVTILLYFNTVVPIANSTDIPSWLIDVLEQANLGNMTTEDYVAFVASLPNGILELLLTFFPT